MERLKKHARTQGGGGGGVPGARFSFGQLQEHDVKIPHACPKRIATAGDHFRPQSPRSFWPAAGIESSGWFQTRKSVNHGLPALLRKLRSLKQKWLPTVTKMHIHCNCAYFGTGQSSRSLPAEGSWALGTRLCGCLTLNQSSSPDWSFDTLFQRNGQRSYPWCRPKGLQSLAKNLEPKCKEKKNWLRKSFICKILIKKSICSNISWNQSSLKLFHYENLLFANQMASLPYIRSAPAQ